MSSAIETLPKLDLARLFPSGIQQDELTATATQMREAWQREGVLHGEIIVDLRQWPDAEEALRAIDAGLQPPDPETLWSYAIVGEIHAPWPELIDIVRESEVRSFRGVLASQEANLMTLGRFWDQARSAGWKRMVHAESAPQLKSAFSLGFERLLGGTVLLREKELVAHLRAHRLPVLVSPSAQVAIQSVESFAHHPIRRLTDAGLTTAIGSGYPTAHAQNLTAELDLLSRHHHFRLDDLRALMARNVEACWIAPDLRFGIARMIESWRHRPHAVPAAKGDGWSL